MGCLPFPGLFTLYATADPAAIGSHHYGPAEPDEPREVGRGIFYTTRAGFLDLAHLRNSIDWTRYCYLNFSKAVAASEPGFTLNGSNGSLFHVRLNYPVDWLSMRPADRQTLATEACIRSAERLAYVMLTWHETASWFGDHTFLFDESPSAFTWDDVMSHVVGVRVAEMALRDRNLPFDRAVTFYLDAQLKALGAVGPTRTQQKVEAIDGLWWESGRPLKRQFDVGLASGVVTPWLVPDPLRPQATAVAFAAPTMGMISGHDFSHFFTARIEPRCDAAKRMRESIASTAAWFDIDRELPQIMSSMRGEMVQQFGRTVNDPFPVKAIEARATHAILTTPRANP